VGLESLGRRQLSFIGPPEPVLFYKLPVFHLTPPHSSAATTLASATGLDCASLPHSQEPRSGAGVGDKCG
jgi:hypothetical protein